MDEKKHEHKWKLLLLLVISSILCLYAYSQQNIINSDGVRYIFAAQCISQGKWKAATEYTKIPFVSSLIALIHFFVRDWVTAGQLLSMISIIFSIIPFYFLVRHIFGNRPAFISSLFFAVSPSFHFGSVQIIRDPTFIFFALLALQQFFYADGIENWKYLCFSMINAIFATLCRTEGIFLCFAFVILIIIYGLRSENIKIRRIVLILSTSLIIFFITGLYLFHQQIARIHRLKTIVQFVTSPNKAYHELGIHKVRAQIKKIEEKIPGGEYGGDILETARNHILEIYFLSLMETLAKSSFPVMFVLGIIGMISLWPFWKQKHILSLFFLWLLFLLIPYLFLLKSNFLSRRYLWIASLLLHTFIGSGVYWIWEKIKKKASFSEKWIVLFLFIALAIPVAKILRRNYRDGNHIKKAGAWLKANIKQKEYLFVVNESRTLFYAGVMFSAQKQFPVLLLKREKDVSQYKAKYIIWEANKAPRCLGSYTKKFMGIEKEKNIYIYLK